MEVKKEDKKILQQNILQQTTQNGCIDSKLKIFDDSDDIGKEEITKYKIINIKVFSATKDNKKVIVGIEYTLRNINSGKTMVKTHKGTMDYEDMYELKIKSGEYLTGLELYYSWENDLGFTQIYFSTSKDNKLSCCSTQNKMFPILINDKKNIIVGFFGQVGTQLNSIGCNYISFEDCAKKELFKFIMLKHLVTSDKKFKKEWDQNYEKLPTDFKFIWKTINMPDNVFVNILRYCL